MVRLRNGVNLSLPSADVGTNGDDPSMCGLIPKPIVYANRRWRITEHPLARGMHVKLDHLESFDTARDVQKTFRVDRRIEKADLILPNIE